MDVLVAAVVGAIVGAAAVLLARRSPSPAPSRATQPAGGLPSGVLAGVLDALGSGAVVIDPADDVVYANPAAQGLGVVRAGRVLSPPLAALVRQTRRTGRGASVDTELPDGRDACARAVLAEDGHVVLLLDDLTETRRLDAVRRDFVANVSHELKTPVGALALLAEALHDAGGDPETTRRFSARMVHEATRLSRLVQELIDLSRLQGADPLPARVPVPAERVVDEALDRTRLAAEARSITVVTGVDPGIDVTGDERQLVTALANLLDNAIAYSAEGTRVSVAVRQRDDEVEISVKDEGIGISPDDSERIFERFYRADPARSRETGGTGLGLAIVKHIASNHGGRVSVWSVEGLGSTFTLHLPSASKAVASPEPAAERARQ